MTKEETLFHEIAAGIPDSKESKMFGALCIKAANGKAGVMFWKNDMVFKLQGKDEEEAMSLKGSQVFTPSDGRSMNGWTHVPAEHAATWKNYAVKAMNYVKTIEEKPKKKKA
jgi:hypothetical protein